MSHVLVAVYDTRGAAESARAEVARLGLAEADVSIHGTGPEAATGTVAGARPFWKEVGSAMFPERDRYLLDEHARRGGWQVVARVPDEIADRAHDALERFDPVDLDERAESWGGEGWRPPGGEAGASAGARSAGSASAPAGSGLAEAPPPPPEEEDPRTVGGFGESIAYAAEPGGGGTVRTPGEGGAGGAAAGGTAARRARVRRYPFGDATRG